MRKRTVLLSIIAAGVAGATASGWVMIRRGFSARDNPSVVETYVAKTARSLSVPASGTQRDESLRADPGSSQRRAGSLADHCAICHSNDGSGKTEIGQNLYPKTPDMRLPDTQNLKDGEIYYVIHNGIRLTGMPAWGKSEKDEDSWKLVLFIRHLPQLTPAEEREMEALNPKGPAEKEEEQEEEQFLNGESSKQIPNKRYSNIPKGGETMKRTVAVFALALALSVIGFAHGNEKHVMGTVTSISDNSITAETTSKKTVTVTFERRD